MTAFVRNSRRQLFLGERLHDTFRDEQAWPPRADDGNNRKRMRQAKGWDVYSFESNSMRKYQPRSQQQMRRPPRARAPPKCEHNAESGHQRERGESLAHTVRR